MSRETNRQLHFDVIREARRRYPVGSLRRMEIICRAIVGIRQTYLPDFNPIHA